jgi:hypothetical protein
MLDCKAVSKIDSVYSGILELGFDGKLGFSGQPSMPLLKSDDNWTIFAYWFESRKKLVRPTFLIQVNSTLINQYDPETRLLQQGFFLPATFHMAYGWKLLQDSNAWSIDLMVADFRWKRYKASGQELTISYAEVGAFIKFQFNGTISKFLTAVVAFEGEFANSNRDGYSYNGKEVILAGQLNWQFQFRTSIEHFFPQNPDEVGNWGDNNLHMFGNLALVTVSGNSRFSNLVPSSKIKSYPSIINQSLKLKVMSEMIDNGNSDWTQDEASKHQEEMFKLIEKDINYKT